MIKHHSGYYKLVLRKFKLLEDTLSFHVSKKVLRKLLTKVEIQIKKGLLQKEQIYVFHCRLNMFTVHIKSVVNVLSNLTIV